MCAMCVRVECSATSPNERMKVLRNRPPKVIGNLFGYYVLHHCDAQNLEINVNYADYVTWENIRH